MPDGGIQEGVYLDNQDLISRFRFFDKSPAECQGNPKDELQAYLDKYTSGPMTKAEILNKIADGTPIEESGLLDRYQIKRFGKDANDLFWKFGKIHGLEYISHCTEDELRATEGDPIKLQRLINKVQDEKRGDNGIGSFDTLLSKFQEKSEQY